MMFSLQDLDLANPDSNLFDLIIKGYVALTAATVVVGIIGCLLTVHKAKKVQETFRINTLRRAGIQEIDFGDSCLLLSAPPAPRH